MTKKLIITCCIIIISATVFIGKANAQIKIGPIVGANFSDISGDFKSDGMHPGFFLGALVNFGISNSVMVEPQVLYSMKGAKGSGDDLKLDYIEIPVWLRYQLGNGLNFNAGPYAGILLSAKRGDTDVKNGFNTVDFGLGVGIGYQLDGGLGFGINYLQGLANVVDADNFSAHNTCIKLSASYTFGGKRD